jgi:RimJ/RimL family protein N-acetyltransferase
MYDAAAIPTLETKRLLLRGHRVTDFPGCVGLWSDLNVTKYITGKASTEQQTWARLLSYVGHWVLLGFGYWVIEEKDTGAFVGEIGFADFKRNVSEHLIGVPELGFALATHFHGKGLATEAAQAVVTWGDTHLPSQQTACMVSVDNVASLQIVNGLGYEECARSVNNEQPVMIFSRAVR